MRKRRRWRNIQYFLALYLVALTFGNLKRAKGAEAQQNGTTNRARGLKSIGNNNNGNNHYNPHYLDEKLRKVRDVDEMRLKRIEKRDQSEKSSEIVNKAVEEAKAASEAQGMAAQQAAHQVKSQLADRAIRAAKAAEAALSGKIALLEQLGEETKEAQIVFQDGSLELEQVRKSTNAAIRMARDSRQQLQMLTKAVNMVKTSMRNADVSVVGAKRSLASKQKLLGAAKKRVEDLVERLHVAEDDLMKIRSVAIKAQEFARNARAKVDRSI
ncbi:uncharacterized protein LOC123273646 [Cotesia glomerata]|uniref:Uncharacterized protein n=1 Tax=Cotesia glomerata TaxID=32391 RepID=A0AAV7I8H8_COTGL|nr:uncharacterized protein LOC123273646 [Cotesia glomerata]KAH0548388.1 hypothetical protein KQX54_001144 [Cotesia glomerata]